MARRIIAALAIAGMLVGGCATAPRGPAASLAAAGISATGSFSAQVRAIAAQLRNAPAAVALTRTLEQCSNTRLTCKEIRESPSVTEQRARLADVVELRARALDALGTAYAALQTEAGYNESADLSGAAGDAVTAANAFAGAAAKLDRSAGTPAIPGIASNLAQFGFGLLGEQLQRKRILAASRQIAEATLQVRNGMLHESAAFRRITRDLVDDRTEARLQLMKAGLVSRNDVLQQVATQLNVTLVPGSDSMIASSAADQVALQAVTRTLAQQEADAAAAGYDQAIAALGALLASHARLEAGKPLGIAEVTQFLTGLNAALAAKGATPPPPAK
jgi:hypothetical protein